jgi:hypothetical protein
MLINFGTKSPRKGRVDEERATAIKLAFDMESAFWTLSTIEVSKTFCPWLPRGLKQLPISLWPVVSMGVNGDDPLFVDFTLTALFLCLKRIL